MQLPRHRRRRLAIAHPGHLRRQPLSAGTAMPPLVLGSSVGSARLHCSCCLCTCPGQCRPRTPHRCAPKCQLFLDEAVEVSCSSLHQTASKTCRCACVACVCGRAGGRGGRGGRARRAGTGGWKYMEGMGNVNTHPPINGCGGSTRRLLRGGSN